MSKQSYRNDIIRLIYWRCTIYFIFSVLWHLFMLSQGDKIEGKNENLTAHQTHLLDGYISANQRSIPHSWVR